MSISFRVRNASSISVLVGNVRPFMLESLLLSNASCHRSELGVLGVLVRQGDYTMSFLICDNRVLPPLRPCYVRAFSSLIFWICLGRFRVVRRWGFFWRGCRTAFGHLVLSVSPFCTPSGCRGFLLVFYPSCTFACVFGFVVPVVMSSNVNSASIICCWMESVPIASTVGGCFLPGASDFDGVGVDGLCFPLVAGGADVITESLYIGGLPDACSIFSHGGSTVT